MAKTDLTAERLREILDYNSETGVFIWKERLSQGSKTRTVAGGVGVAGYSRIGIFGRRYTSHRLAWLHVYGEWPKFEVDHINGDRTDNRICNLRDVSRQINAQNRTATNPKNKSGFLGVTMLRDQWRANIFLNGKQTHLGIYPTAQLAHQAYVDAKQKSYPIGV